MHPNRSPSHVTWRLTTSSDIFKNATRRMGLREMLGEISRNHGQTNMVSYRFFPGHTQFIFSDSFTSRHSLSFSIRKLLMPSIPFFVEWFLRCGVLSLRTGFSRWFHRVMSCIPYAVLTNDCGDFFVEIPKISQKKRGVQKKSHCILAESSTHLKSPLAKCSAIGKKTRFHSRIDLAENKSSRDIHFFLARLQLLLWVYYQ